MDGKRLRRGEKRERRCDGSTVVDERWLVVWLQGRPSVHPAVTETHPVDKMEPARRSVKRGQQVRYGVHVR
jgi:hypothetical protein